MSLGIGMLINTVGSMTQGPNVAGAQKQFESSMRGLRQTLQESNQSVLQRYESKGPTHDWHFEPPPFPQEKHQNLQQLQQQHLDARLGFRDQMRQQLSDAKDQFFGENHYETESAPDGKPKVLVRDGQPVPQKGPESPAQRVAREEFEGTRRREMETSQDLHKETFLKKEQQETRQFLAQNQLLLGDPNVQAQLQRMITETNKKALDLEQEHEAERWKVDVPPVPEMTAMVDDNLANLRQMEKDQAEIEERSPDYQALLDHEQKLALLLSDQKEEARRQKRDEMFLKDPRQAMAAMQAPPDFAEVLPSYLTNALYNMEIYSA